MWKWMFIQKKDYMAIVNNTTDAQETEVFDGEGQVESITLAPSELRWEELSWIKPG